MLVAVYKVAVVVLAGTVFVTVIVVNKSTLTVAVAVEAMENAKLVPNSDPVEEPRAPTSENRMVALPG